MSFRMTVNPSWEAELTSEAEVFHQRILHEVAADAEALAPKRTGHLASTIEVTGDRVVATASYAAYVELGTRHMHAEPYLAPATYKKRH